MTCGKDLKDEKEKSGDLNEVLLRKLCGKLKASKPSVELALGEGAVIEFNDAIEELEVQDNIEGFDWEWHDLYDWADANRVWIGIF